MKVCKDQVNMATLRGRGVIGKGRKDVRFCLRLDRSM
jgi:hypothetical protein